MDLQATPTPPHRRPWGWLVLAAMLVAFWLWSSSRQAAPQPDVDYTQALAWIREGKVKQVTLTDTTMTGVLAEPQKLDGASATTFKTNVPKDDRLVPLLEDQDVEV